MTEGIARWVGVVITATAILPVAGVVVIALARCRSRFGVPPRRAWTQTVAEVGMVVGTLPWIWMILTPLPAATEVRPVPLLDLWQLLHGPKWFAFYQIAGNLLVFAAFGFLAPLRWPISPTAVLAVAAIASAVVETLQFVLALGRVSSIDDVTLNAVGAGLAALASRRSVGRLWARDADHRGARAPRYRDRRPHRGAS